MRWVDGGWHGLRPCSRVNPLLQGGERLSPRFAGLMRKDRHKKARIRLAYIDGPIAKITIGQLSGAETDGRLLAVRARFSRVGNLVDFLIYLIGYL